MTEQEKFTALYKTLSPDEKAVLIFMMQTFTNMLTLFCKQNKNEREVTSWKN